MNSDRSNAGRPPKPTPEDPTSRDLRGTDQGAVDAFLRQVSVTPRRGPTGGRGRLIFALDATASREPTWAQATRIQSAMFSETRDLGGLEVQLCFYRGVLELSASRMVR